LARESPEKDEELPFARDLVQIFEEPVRKVAERVTDLHFLCLPHHDYLIPSLCLMLTLSMLAKALASLTRAALIIIF
jgi:hypothetical protein